MIFIPRSCVGAEATERSQYSKTDKSAQPLPALQVLPSTGNTMILMVWSVAYLILELLYLRDVFLDDDPLHAFKFSIFTLITDFEQGSAF